MNRHSVSSHSVSKRRGRRSTRRDSGELEICDGLLELHPDGYGFLRQCDSAISRRGDDPFVPASLIETHGLRQGLRVQAEASCRGGSGRGPRVTTIRAIDGKLADAWIAPGAFEDRLARNPSQWLRLEHPDQPVSMRVLDLMTPIGRGQRALIAAPPRAGKTTLLRQIATSLSLNHPELHLIALLVDERPEEIGDMASVVNGELFASSLDRRPEDHARLSRLVIDRCHRLVEQGRDVVLMVDSLTRMTRAFNKLPGPPGAMGPGGLQVRALEVPRQLFASARAFADGGSLTILASLLVQTDNRMDDVIFREFKGTGNLDLVLNQDLADQGIWPAVDLKQSATRRIELLQDADTLAATRLLRNSLLKMPPAEAMSQLTRQLERCGGNGDFLKLIAGTQG